MRRGLKNKNPFFQYFFVSFHISIYNSLAPEKPIILASNAQVRPTKGNAFLVRCSLGEGGFRNRNPLGERPMTIYQLPFNHSPRALFREIRDARYYIRDTLHASRDTNNELQSKLNDYTKQTQFPKCPNGCKRSYDKQL